MPLKKSYSNSASPPSYEQAMLNLSRRLRRKLGPPESKQYADLGVSERPGLAQAALDTGAAPPTVAKIRGRQLRSRVKAAGAL